MFVSSMFSITPQSVACKCFLTRPFLLRAVFGWEERAAVGICMHNDVPYHASIDLSTRGDGHSVHHATATTATTEQLLVHAFTCHVDA
jgi:hypothetical protein